MNSIALLCHSPSLSRFNFNSKTLMDPIGFLCINIIDPFLFATLLTKIMVTGVGVKAKKIHKSAKVMDENIDEASKMPEITSSIPFLLRIVFVRNICEN
ncbi:hypothetical protein GIB67_024992 [Kingdonia uniflora]|uniref:Uncharacterized protein n=1 Tax=Kingdonia uniflora TaxID=39325 RepID=A0A7J7N8A5_9MAGN|nr:hypothetical protein GIB67_024992 [Kingdonia uniflora]